MSHLLVLCLFKAFFFFFDFFGIFLGPLCAHAYKDGFRWSDSTTSSHRTEASLEAGIMATGPDVIEMWLLSSGVVSFFMLLLILSIFLTGLCSDCGRHSFELQDPEVNRTPSTLISVVKLEEVRENPTINEIQNDEKQSRPEEEVSVQFTPWRSHLGVPQSQDQNAEHIYHTIGGHGTNPDISSPPMPANHKPARAHDAALEDFSNYDRNSVYAQVSKKLSSSASPPPVHTPAEIPVEEEEESSPPLPERTAEMEG
ncbi:uncharacterized protein si:ch73-204p21.2 isoform X1 [Oreochromis niloticus]|uniref:uncharacterized protein si:ch73-204p21.2 isoform X1 n=1 Tax=Oreochromis niloticus TaxID=8128 RepID=UPI000394599A|nr:uncharacterized protein LOC100691497 isoform X1 [Oreochromis niloticus]CAI5646411.1 unnamed protein product [Mustela putorius furo]